MGRRFLQLILALAATIALAVAVTPVASADSAGGAEKALAAICKAQNDGTYHSNTGVCTGTQLNGGDIPTGALKTCLRVDGIVVVFSPPPIAWICLTP
jgi:uncharacterized membrane protein